MTHIRQIPRSVFRTIMRPVCAALHRRANKRDVLLVCSSTLMADYLADIWEVLRGDRRLRLRVLMPFEQERAGAFDQIRAKLPAREIKSYWAHVRKWDLMVLADLTHGDLVDGGHCPTIQVLHGYPGKLVDGEIYAFGKRMYNARGQVRYTRVFVSSEAAKELAVRMDRALEDTIAVVGSPDDDKTLAEMSRRDAHRKALGFGPEDVVVFVMSTWGPDSLVHRMGDALLAKARELQGEFRFVFSVHPLEYKPSEAGGRVWGEYLREQKRHGFVVREPWESWVPYMVASDILLTDHTSLAMHGLALSRPLVYVPVPDEAVARDSLIWQLREMSPVVKEDASDLRDCLLKAKEHYPFDKLREAAQQLNSYPGQAAGRIRQEVYTLLGLPGPTLPGAPPACASAEAHEAVGGDPAASS